MSWREPKWRYTYTASPSNIGKMYDRGLVAAIIVSAIARCFLYVLGESVFFDLIIHFMKDFSVPGILFSPSCSSVFNGG